jgi:hypothetical protein
MTPAEGIARVPRQGCALGPQNAPRIAPAAPRALFPPPPQPAVHRRLCSRARPRVARAQHASAALTPPLADVGRPPPARPVAGMPGAAASLGAPWLAAIDAWPRLPAGRERWATAGGAPSPCHAGTSGPATPHVSTIGGPPLRPALDWLTTALVWQAPPVGSPGCQRLLQGTPVVPPLRPSGRQGANPARALLPMAPPCRPRGADPPAPKARLPYVQDRSRARTHPEAHAGAARPPGGSPPPCV